MTEPTNSTTPTTPTAGQRLDAGIAWTRAEWTKRNAAIPKFKWIALGSGSFAFLLAFVIFVKLMSVVFGPHYPGKPSKDAYDRFYAGMSYSDIDRLLGPANDGFNKDGRNNDVWIIDDSSAIVLRDRGQSYMVKSWDTTGEWKKLKAESDREKNFQRALKQSESQAVQASPSTHIEADSIDLALPEQNLVNIINTLKGELGVQAEANWQDALNYHRQGNDIAARKVLELAIGSCKQEAAKSPMQALYKKWGG